MNSPTELARLEVRNLAGVFAARQFGRGHKIRITGNQNKLVDLALVGEGCDV